MNIKVQGFNTVSNFGLKSTQDRIERQMKRDTKVAFFEEQKEKLKSMKADTLDDIARKLDMLQGYNEQIDAVKKEYNNSQVFHVMDEAREKAEKIKEQAEKYAPKTAEERIEDMIEEATGTDENEGMMSELLEEISDSAEEMQEALEENLEKTAEVLEENLSDMVAETGLVREGSTVTTLENGMKIEDDGNLLHYKRIDILI